MERPGIAPPPTVTDALIARVQHDGTYWLSGTVWHGQTAMRVSVSNWSATPADVEPSADAILNAANAITSYR